MKKQIQLLTAGLFFPFLMTAQWAVESTGFATPSRGLWDISIADTNTAWAVAYDGTIGIFGGMVPEFTKTLDGGNNFTPGLFPPGTTWSNICAINGNTAWAAVNNSSGVNGAVYKTNDGGTSWHEQGVSIIYNSTSYIDFVHFWNGTDGVAVGDPNPSEFEIYTTNDGGNSWIPVPGSVIPDPLTGEFGVWKNFCTVGNDIWFGTNKARIFHSPDKGLTWTASATGIPMTSGVDYYIDFAFWNSNEGIARKYDNSANVNSYVVRTNDGGLTWNPVTFTGTLFGCYYSGIAYVPGTTSTLISTGLNSIATSGSSYSNDGGNTWNIMDQGIPHFGAKFLNPATGWSGNFNTSSTHGGIFKYSGLPLGIQNSENRKEIYFNAYPNPSYGNIMVQLNNGENANLKISVLDLFGRTIFENDYGKPGEFFIHTIDLSRFSKGVYVLKIENGNLVHSKEIILK